MFKKAFEAIREEFSGQAAKGCVVIDNSSAWRTDPDVPLIVPEVNADAIETLGDRRIIANPNCSTAQLVVALKPLHDRAGVKRAVILSPAFVADCLETLEELGLRAAEDWRNDGGEQLELVASLNSDDRWVEALVRIARETTVGIE